MGAKQATPITESYETSRPAQTAGSFTFSDVSFTSKNPRVSIGYSLALVSNFSDLPSACPSLMIPVLTDCPLFFISPFSLSLCSRDPVPERTTPGPRPSSDLWCGPIPSGTLCRPRSLMVSGLARTLGRNTLVHAPRHEDRDLAPPLSVLSGKSKSVWVAYLDSTNLERLPHIKSIPSVTLPPSPQLFETIHASAPGLATAVSDPQIYPYLPGPQKSLPLFAQAGLVAILLIMASDLLEAFVISPLSLLGTRHVSHPFGPEGVYQGLARKQPVVTKHRGCCPCFRTLRDIFADLACFISYEGSRLTHFRVDPAIFSCSAGGIGADASGPSYFNSLTIASWTSCGMG